MSLLDVDHVEGNLVAESLVQLLDGAQMAPKWRSGIRAENQGDGAFSFVLGDADKLSAFAFAASAVNEARKAEGESAVANADLWRSKVSDLRQSLHVGE